MVQNTEKYYFSQYDTNLVTWTNAVFNKVAFFLEVNCELLFPTKWNFPVKWPICFR